SNTSDSAAPTLSQIRPPIASARENSNGTKLLLIKKYLPGITGFRAVLSHVRTSIISSHVGRQRVILAVAALQILRANDRHDQVIRQGIGHRSHSRVSTYRPARFRVRFSGYAIAHPHLGRVGRNTSDLGIIGSIRQRDLKVIGSIGESQQVIIIRLLPAFGRSNRFQSTKDGFALINRPPNIIYPRSFTRAL